MHFTLHTEIPRSLLRGASTAARREMEKVNKESKVQASGPNHIRVLLIEDNPGDVQLLREALREPGGSVFKAEHAEQLSMALARLAEGGVDVVLLDLGLPDSQGLDTFLRLHAQAPEVPVVVLTGLADDILATEAMRRGAQDYLVKGEVNGALLVRALRYAIERQRLLTELEQVRFRERQEKESRSLERISGHSSTTVTAGLFGAAPLRESMPDVFDELMQNYLDLIDLALEKRVFKVEHDLSEKLRALAEQIGFLRAGPRDVVEIYARALKRKAETVSPQKSQACAEEGRLMVLELMGYLVSYYRRHSLISGKG